MLNVESKFLDMINSPVRNIKARVELLNGSTLVETFKYNGALKSFTVERVGNMSKFFGYGIYQKANVKLRDKDRVIDISTANHLEIVFGVDSDYVYPYPAFKVSEVNRDENTNALSITAYDALYEASKHLISEVEIAPPYTIREVAGACGAFLGLPVGVENITDTAFDTLYEGGANFEGSETIREVLDAIAEATQTIYYINSEWVLTFKRLSLAGEAVYSIGKANYMTLKSKTNRKLAKIVSATELGDNVSASLTTSGSTQYVRDNPFWELREDIDTLVSNALTNVGGLKINQFECKWRGNFLLEIGDRISLTTKDNDVVYSYILNDVVKYDGTLSEDSEWEYEDNDEETASNPVSLGDTLKQTYARVDKVNKQIDLVASKADTNEENIASLQLTTNDIKASVSETKTAISTAEEDIATLTQKVEAQITAEDVNLQISSALDNGVSKVETTTGFTFNQDGLTVSKSGSEMKTTITEDGMTVYRDGDEVLIADNEGVKAEDLHATTYLIIGKYSRLEDYGNRTGCFWIGD